MPIESYFECSRCLLNSNDSKTFFLDDEGVCNYCRYFETKINEIGDAEKRKPLLEGKITEIKNFGQKKKYDCLLGLSGGVDSSYIALLAHKWNLRPLVVHLDNGWNSDISVRNIEKICTKFNFELYTHVIDGEEFVSLQKAYLKAGVIDIEVLTDHAIYAILYRLAEKYRVKYILSGFNYATEAIMPTGWTYNKRDFLNIKDIVRKHGEGVKIKSFPYVSFFKALYYHWFLKLESVQILNYIDYNKEKAKQELKEFVGWVDYGGKHYESIFTKFYQAYILPKKFGIDKRRAHLSNQICNGEISKDLAQQYLRKDLYAKTELAEEKKYILKKLGWSENEFDEIMQDEIRSHSDYDTDQRLWNKYFHLINTFKLGR